jgi:hypothetical protein
MCFQKEYFKKKGETYQAIKRVLALPFVPVSDVRDLFARIVLEAPKNDRLDEFLRYVKRTWFDSTVYTLDSWSCHRRLTRTNNEVEGWHRRVNSIFVDQTPAFYMLIPALHKEATKLGLQDQLVSDGLLAKRERKEVGGKLPALAFIITILLILFFCLLLLSRTVPSS